MDAKQLFQLVHAAERRYDSIVELLNALRQIPASLAHPTAKFRLIRRPEEKMTEQVAEGYLQLQYTYETEAKAIEDFAKLYKDELYRTYECITEVFGELEANDEYKALYDGKNGTDNDSLALRDLIQAKEREFVGLYYNLKIYDTRLYGVLSYSQNKLEAAHNNYVQRFAAIIYQHYNKIEAITNDKLNQLKSDPSMLSQQALKVLYSLQLYEQGNVVSSTPVVEGSNDMPK